jgi:hypothetical protein
MTENLNEIEKLSAAITSDNEDVKAAVKAHLEAYVEQQFKTIGYLFVAHGAGLVSCITFIKEKSGIPGVQVATSLFAYGFLTAIVAYGFTVALSHEGRTLFIFGTYKKIHRLTLWVSSFFMMISVGLLMVGVLFVARNLGAF